MTGPASPSPQTSISLSKSALPRKVRQILQGFYELAADGFERELAGALNEFEQQAFHNAEQARSNNIQVRWLETLRTIRRTRPDLVPRFLQGIESHLATIREPAATEAERVTQRNASELSLIDASEMDESTTLAEIGSRIEMRHSLPIYLLGQRFGVLAGKPAFDAEALPVGPQTLCKILRNAAANLEISPDHRVLLYRLFERQMLVEYGRMLEALNAHLIKNGVLPGLQYMPFRSPAAPQARAGAKPATEAKGPESTPDAAAQPDGTAGRTTAQQPAYGRATGQQPAYGRATGQQPAYGRSTGQFPAMPRAEGEAEAPLPWLLPGEASAWEPQGPASAPVQLPEFDQIRDLLTSRRTMLSKLSGAAAAPAAPSGPVHQPAQQEVQHALSLLQPSTATSVNMGGRIVPRTVAHLQQDLLAQLRRSAPAGESPGDDDADGALVSKMQGLVDRTLRDFDGDMSLFESLLKDLSSHLQMIARKAEVAERRHVEAARGKERLAQARDRAADAVKEITEGSELPVFTRTLLNQAWTDVMALTSLRHGEESAAWKQHLETAKKLVSLAKPGAAAAAETEAPTLQKEVADSLRQVGYHEAESDAIAKRLIAPATEPAADDAASRTELLMRMKSANRLGTTEKPAKPKPEQLTPEVMARVAQIKTLAFGTWFEFVTNAQGDRVRRRLSWYSPVSGTAMFVNHRGQKIGDQSIEHLAIQMANGQARLVEEEAKVSLLDRAWGAVMKTLSGFGGKPKEAVA